MDSVVAAIPDIGFGSVALRLTLAAGLGAAVGLEREFREREAGLRTHCLVAVGSALFTLASAYGFHEFLTEGGAVVRADPTRIAAQIVTGIGFIGAGAILREGMAVRGITTAATLWVVAAIGLACGAGYYSAAVVGTALVLFALWPLRILARQIVDRGRPPNKHVEVSLPSSYSVAPLLSLLEGNGLQVESYTFVERQDQRVVTMGISRPPNDLISLISKLPDVTAVRWSR